ncbi:type II toxin-antitoxin system RelB/DinJ family antitoxin [Synergistes jonesii]|uniref:type II toxin-antitoxin system RelB/DinJ family antitoxin n=1 Tax=Synergistes jonesii TaxID=2754 RepID=UPI003326BDA3
MPTTSMNIRMDSEVKKEAQELFSEFGLDMTTAINIFLRQSIRERALPFELRMTAPKPNAATLASMDEGDGIIKSGRRRFTTADEMFSELGI